MPPIAGSEASFGLALRFPTSVSITKWSASLGDRPFRRTRRNFLKRTSPLESWVWLLPLSVDLRHLRVSETVQAPLRPSRSLEPWSFLLDCSSFCSAF